MSRRIAVDVSDGFGSKSPFALHSRAERPTRHSHIKHDRTKLESALPFSKTAMDDD